MLWADVEPIYAAILAHPFVSGLADGTLPREAFRHYIVQDAHYLRGYARALALCAAKATDPADTVMFAEHAAGAVAAERDLHAALMHELGGTAAQAAREPVAPTTRAYVSYLLAAAYGGSFAEAVGRCCPATGSTPGSARSCWPAARRIRCTRAGSRCTAARSSRPWSTRCWTLTDRVGAASPRPSGS